jgi:hypothetical protein
MIAKQTATSKKFEQPRNRWSKSAGDSRAQVW